MAGLDRAITLRRNFTQGMPVVPVAGNGSPDSPFVYDSLPIDVANMSFGGLTDFAGRDLFNRLVLKALEAGIVPVVAAANDGPAAMTVSSPATSFGALSVGAIDAAATNRLWEDMNHGVGTGALLRPDSGVQAAYFSSRGPTADGRIRPDMAALGRGNLHIAPYAVTTAGAIDFCNWFIRCQAPVRRPQRSVPARHTRRRSSPVRRRFCAVKCRTPPPCRFVTPCRRPPTRRCSQMAAGTSIAAPAHWMFPAPCSFSALAS